MAMSLEQYGASSVMLAPNEINNNGLTIVSYKDIECDFRLETETSCFVKKCFSASSDSKHFCPPEPQLIKEWRQNLPKREIDFNPIQHGVCVRHFHKSFIVNRGHAQDWIERKVHTTILYGDAVPTIFEHYPHFFQKAVPFGPRIVQRVIMGYSNKPIAEEDERDGEFKLKGKKLDEAKINDDEGCQGMGDEDVMGKVNKDFPGKVDDEGPRKGDDFDLEETENWIINLRKDASIAVEKDFTLKPTKEFLVQEVCDSSYLWDRDAAQKNVLASKEENYPHLWVKEAAEPHKMVTAEVEDEHPYVCGIEETVEIELFLNDKKEISAHEEEREADLDNEDGIDSSIEDEVDLETDDQFGLDTVNNSDYDEQEDLVDDEMEEDHGFFGDDESGDEILVHMFSIGME